jgi:hypothetical protein
MSKQGEVGCETARAEDRRLRTNIGGESCRASGRFERLKEVALAHAFALKIAGLGGEQA